MFILYDLIFLIFAVFYLPIYLFKGKFHRGFLQRLGVLPKNLKLGRPIWIHAVSVGEVMVVKGLLDELRIAYPEKRFVISTVTATGNRIAQKFAKDTDFVTYLPLDFSFIIKSVIDRINPLVFIIAETEIWPNLILYLHRKNIPVIIVNGRISDHSFRGYSVIKFFLKPILNKINFFCMQSSIDAERLRQLGAAPDKIQVTGNMKFDALDYISKDYADYRLKLGLRLEEKLLFAGSTHPGEEEMILDVYKDLLKDYPNLRLFIAPRHPERATEIERLVNRNNFQPLRISKIDIPPILVSVFILDTIGQLINYYAIADIVFVGGSLIKKGGHNILEPAFLGKPIIFGPYMFNFRDIADLFIKNNACIQVDDKQDLETAIRDLLDNPYKMQMLGSKAKVLISENQGATKRNLGLILRISR